MRDISSDIIKLGTTYLAVEDPTSALKCFKAAHDLDTRANTADTLNQPYYGHLRILHGDKNQPGLIQEALTMRQQPAGARSTNESQTESSYLFEIIKKEYQRHSHIERIINPSKSFPIEQSYINVDIVETKKQQEREKKLTRMAHNRFVNSVFPELQEANCSPIYGYQHLPVLTLEEAIEKIVPLVPGIVECVSTAKKKCNRSSTLLTRDESAAIYLYSMHIPFFSCVNKALRTEDRHALKPWFAFLKLFVTALEKLPSLEATVWRGVSGDVGSDFDDGNVHTWWSVNSCSTDLKVVEQYLDKTGTLFAIDTIHGRDISAFSTFPEEKEVLLMPGTRLIVKCQSLNVLDRFFLVHLDEENSQSESQNGASYLFGLIKQKYQQNNRIERAVNPSKSFPVEQSYINLSIVETKEQQEKEKKLLSKESSEEIIGTYEEIYGMKTRIEIKDIFEKCKDQMKNILVLGRAGIGKTTFCRYVTYQWATGAILQQYQLVILISLRSLTENRYPPLVPGAKYSLIDIVKTEYFHQGLSDKYERLLKERLDISQVLWLLDGYDEIVQNVPSHLEYLLEQLLKTPHHILTSRPYLNTLSYTVKLEITGFTDDHIKKYAEQFFGQIKNEIDNASLQAQNLLSFLKSNLRIWDIVHIPVNLELICSLWCDTDWSETMTLTMTTVYDKMIEWLCRRYLEKQNISSSEMTKEDIYTHIHKELAFLESLGFNGMESKSIILPQKILRIAYKDSQCSLQHQSHLLNIGILKSLDYKPIGTRIEVDKNHYFLHLSFQEHFAARYLVNALNGTADQKKKAIDFIKFHKYNQRYELLFTFASGLLIDGIGEQCMNLFWETLLGEPLDLIGLRHVQIVISCLEEAGCNRNIPRFPELISLIIKWINYFVSAKDNFWDHRLSVSLERSPTLVNKPEILDTFTKLYKDEDPIIKKTASSFISDLPISNRYLDLIQLHLTALNDENMEVRRSACDALGKMGEKAAACEVINRLVILVGDTDQHVRSSAWAALEKMGEKATTNEVINRLLILLGDTNKYVKESAWKVLEKMGEKAATSEVINRLLILLTDTDKYVRCNACQVLEKMGEKAATSEVTNRLLFLLGDTNYDVRESAWKVLEKMGEKAATSEVINRLLILTGDTNYDVRESAWKVLEKMGEKAATNEVINRLLIPLGDTNYDVKESAWKVLEKMGEKAATNEVINRLLILLYDTNYGVRKRACSAVEKMGQEVPTNAVINRLMILLGATDDVVRWSACSALEKMGEKVAIGEVINRLMILLGDTNYFIRKSAYSALGKMGEKVSTNEVINRLKILLDATDGKVRISACKALEKMGEKAATNEVINRLSVLLGDTDEDVKMSACDALGQIGDKAATNVVKNKLMILLGDTKDFIRWSAWKALDKMSGKIPTNEVINSLMNLLGDTDDRVRSGACQTLGKMGEKAATNEMISRLSILLGDTEEDVRRSACNTLRQIGNKAATNEVRNRLITLLGDRDDDVRWSAWKGLEKMGEKVPVNEVINRLMILLGDTNEDARRSACENLGQIGEKAASNAVINGLVIAFGDKNNSLRFSACDALGQMGKKAATDEVIGVLLDAYNDGNSAIQYKVADVIKKIFDLLPCLSNLKDDTVRKLSKCIHQSDFSFLENISPEKFIKAFLQTEILFWLPVIRRVLLPRRGYAITVTENTIVVYGTKDPVELSFSYRRLGEQLKDCFVNWLDKSLERCA